jgi:hypothetical protein
MNRSSQLMGFKFGSKLQKSGGSVLSKRVSFSAADNKSACVNRTDTKHTKAFASSKRWKWPLIKRAGGFAKGTPKQKPAREANSARFKMIYWFTTTPDTIKQLALWHARGQWGSGSLIRLLFMHFSLCLQILSFCVIPRRAVPKVWPLTSAHDQSTLT